VPPTNANIYAVFATRFPADATAPFIEDERGTTWSYTDLECESARFAAFLSGLGVSAGDRVAVQVDKSPQAMFLYLACLRAGFIYLPLNTAYLESELAYFLQDAEPAVVVCRPPSLELMNRLAHAHRVKHVFTLDADNTGSLIEHAADATPAFTTVTSRENDTAVIL
jgi:malonyl-CoA/methylmalonyl-CoA synthetase